MYHADATFEESTREDELARLLIGVVHVQNAVGFARQVEGIGRLRLHAEGLLETLDARLQPALVGALLLMNPVELTQEIKLGSLLLNRNAVVADVLDEPIHVFVPVIDEGPPCKRLEEMLTANSASRPAGSRPNTWR